MTAAKNVREALEEVLALYGALTGPVQPFKAKHFIDEWSDQAAPYLAAVANLVQDHGPALLASISATAAGDAVEIRLWDSQYVNVVNDPELLAADDPVDAVARAVKLTEQAIAKNYRDNKWPPAKAAQESPQ